MRLQLNKMINKYFVLPAVWSTCIEKQLSKMAAGGYDLVGINALIWLSQLSFERCSPKVNVILSTPFVIRVVDDISMHFNVQRILFYRIVKHYTVMVTALLENWRRMFQKI